MRFLSLVLVALLLAPTLAAQNDADELPSSGLRRRLIVSWLAQARDTERPLPQRLSALKRVGDAADSSALDGLREALADQTPEIRQAVLRALAGIGGAESAALLRERLADRAAEPKERAWAARGLGETGEAEKSVPALIDYLDSAEGQGRLAALESLSRLTGLTQGQAGGVLLRPGSPGGTDADEAASLADRWRDWWASHQGESAAQWQSQALTSEISKDRAAAARALSAAGDAEAVPALLQRLREEPLSGVRDALAKALNRLTGRRVPYRAWVDVAHGESEETWRTQHDAALRAWQEWWDEGGSAPRTLAERLLAPEAASKTAALRDVDETADDAALTVCIEALADANPAVREAAFEALERALGFVWPFDADADAEVRLRQVARWSEWWEEHRFASTAARLLSALADPEQLQYGESGLSGEALAAHQAELRKTLNSRRAKTLRRLAALAEGEAGPAALQLFERGLGALERAVQRSENPPVDFPTGVQLQLAYLMGRVRPEGGATLLLARLVLGAPAQASSKLRLSVDDAEVRAACAWALGEYGGDSRAVEEALLEGLSEGDRNALLVRAACVEALGKRKDVRALEDVLAVLDHDRSAAVKANAAWAVGEIAAADDRGRKDSIAALAAALAEDSSAVRREALLALERLTGKSFEFRWAGESTADRAMRATQIETIRRALRLDE